MKEEDDQLVPNLPRGGPLDRYRRQATFDWRRFKVKFFAEDVLRFKASVWRKLAEDPVFDKGPESSCPSLEDYRSATMRRTQSLVEMEFVTPSSLMQNPLRHPAFVSAVGAYDWSLLAKQSLLYDFCTMAIQGSGTEQHREILGAFQARAVTGWYVGMSCVKQSCATLPLASA